MQIVKSLPMTMRLNSPNGISEADVILNDYVKEMITEFISSRGRCVCIHSSISDYTYSVRGNNYTQMNPMEVAGYITNVDWNTRELTMKIDDSYTTEGSLRYVPDKDWDNYQLRLRGSGRLNHSKESSRLEFHLGRLIGFDLIKIEETGENENA